MRPLSICLEPAVASRYTRRPTRGCLPGKEVGVKPYSKWLALCFAMNISAAFGQTPAAVEAKSDPAPSSRPDTPSAGDKTESPPESKSTAAAGAAPVRAAGEH